MRGRETIDSELRLLAAVRRVCREYDGRVPSMNVGGRARLAHRKLTALMRPWSMFKS
jgi:hypothetical protein